MELRVAYLAQGKLFVTGDGRDVDSIESPYAQELIDDAIRQRQKNEWKTRSHTGQIMAGVTPWAAGGDPGARRVHFSGITHGDRQGELLYALDTDSVGGLFLFDTAERSERRLFHGNQFKARHLARHPDGRQIAFSSPSEDGTASIVVMDLQTNELHHVTEGDSQDEAPAWMPGGGNRLVFQSAGIGRNQQGHIAGLGPYALQQLDIDREELTTLVEDEKTDYLLPRVGADGTLYYIRRPYQVAPRVSPFRILLDVILFPIRLLWALLGFFNFFSLMFSGKPLMTAGGPKREGHNPRHMLLWGKLIDAERAERAAAKGGEAGLVPKDWQLVRRKRDGSDEVIAESVVSYDLCEDGGVVFTNGNRVFHLAANGNRRALCDGKLIEHVMVAG